MPFNNQLVYNTVNLTLRLEYFTIMEPDTIYYLNLFDSSQNVCKPTYFVNGLHLNGYDRDGKMVPPAEGDDTTKRLRVSIFSTRAHRELKVGCESEEDIKYLHSWNTCI